MEVQNPPKPRPNRNQRLRLHRLKENLESRKDPRRLRARFRGQNRKKRKRKKKENMKTPADTTARGVRRWSAELPKNMASTFQLSRAKALDSTDVSRNAMS